MLKLILVKNIAQDSSQRNRLYRQIDVAILELIFSDPINMNITAICQKAGISRYTFYRHYHSKAHAIRRFKSNARRSFSGLLADLPDAASPADNYRLFRSLFFYLGKREDKIYYYVLTNDVNHGVIKQLVKLLYPKLYIEWTAKGVAGPRLTDRRVRIYLHALLVVLCEWAEKERCDIRQYDRYITALVAITADVRRWCVR